MYKEVKTNMTQFEGEINNEEQYTLKQHANRM